MTSESHVAMAAEIAQLTVELAEAEAERDEHKEEAQKLAGAHIEAEQAVFEDITAERDELKARLAEAEARGRAEGMRCVRLQLIGCRFIEDDNELGALDAVRVLCSRWQKQARNLEGLRAALQAVGKTRDEVRAKLAEAEKARNEEINRRDMIEYECAELREAVERIRDLLHLSTECKRRDEFCYRSDSKVCCTIQKALDVPAGAKAAEVLKAADDLEKAITRGGFDTLTTHPLTEMKPMEKRVFDKAGELVVFVRAVRARRDDSISGIEPVLGDSG